jgi:energy-coupling factor transport system ATP-binding protein
MRVYAHTPKTDGFPCPVTIRDGRRWLEHVTARKPPIIDCAAARITDNPGGDVRAIELDGAWFRYEKQSPDVIKGMSLNVSGGEFLCMLGGNGTGKTTALSLICGAHKPYRGDVKLFGRDVKNYGGELFGGVLGVLPQNPKALFVKKTIFEDLLDTRGLDDAEKKARISEISTMCRIDDILTAHPYDVSGGELQRAALAKILLSRPRALLLDEPTKGLDAAFKQIFAGILTALNDRGVAVLMVSHDVEFCAEYAQRCALVFDGAIISEGTPRDFFSNNSFYTTAANRMARGFIPGAVTAGDVITALGGDYAPPRKPAVVTIPTVPDVSVAPVAPVIPAWRKIAGGCAALTTLLAIAFIIRNPSGFMAFIYGDILTMPRGEIWTQAAALSALCAGVVILFGALFYKRDAAFKTTKRAVSRKRVVIVVAVILLLIPFTILMGMYVFDSRRYYITSMLIILETLLPFALIFESRKPAARELAIISALCAIGVAGRLAFFMVPQFKPTAAVIIIAGAAFGAETGFLVGAITAFTSDMFFGQGPWTPWQMFAFGIVGFLAGALFNNGVRVFRRAALSVFGAFATIAVYGGIMNSAMVLMYQEKPALPMFLAAYAQGIPFDVVHAVATTAFLWFAAVPVLEKLDRLKVKYVLTDTS